MSLANYATPTGVSVINASSSGAIININMNEVATDIFSNSNDVLRLVGLPNADGKLFIWECLHNSSASDFTTRNLLSKCQGTY